MRLESMERMLLDLHWHVIGQCFPMWHLAGQQMQGTCASMPEFGQAEQNQCSHPPNSSQSLSTSSKRRRRAKALRERLWSTLQTNQSPKHDSKLATGDHRRMPQQAWETIYRRFHNSTAQISFGKTCNGASNSTSRHESSLSLNGSYLVTDSDQYRIIFEDVGQDALLEQNVNFLNVYWFLRSLAVAHYRAC